MDTYCDQRQQPCLRNAERFVHIGDNGSLKSDAGDHLNLELIHHCQKGRWDSADSFVFNTQETILQELQVHNINNVDTKRSTNIKKKLAEAY